MCLKIAYLGIIALLLHSILAYPPPIRSQQHTLPLLKIFIFFIFLPPTFDTPCVSIVAVCCQLSDVWLFNVVCEYFAMFVDMLLFLCYKRKFIVSLNL